MKSSEFFKLAMIVDDNEIDNLVGTKMIEHALCASKIINFYCAQSALKYLNKNIYQLDQIPDIIFLDINMPEMNGFEFLDRFNALPRSLKDKCKIVMLTSSIDRSDINNTLSHSCVTNFISKPLSIKALHKLKENLVSID